MSFSGWLFQNDYTPTSFGDALAHISELTSVTDDSIVSVTSNYFIPAATNLKSLNLPNLEEITGEHFVEGAPNLEYVNLPKLRKVYITGTGLFAQNKGYKLTELTLP